MYKLVLIRHGEGEEREVVKREDLEWRSVDAFGIDSLYFESFHGGSDKSWAPSRPSFAEFGDFVIKPWSNERLLATVQRAVALRRAGRTLVPAFGAAAVEHSEGAIVASAPPCEAEGGRASARQASLK